MKPGFFVVLAVFSVLVLSGCTVPVEPVCGNNVCEEGETPYTCSADCGAPGPVDMQGEPILGGVKPGVSILGFMEFEGPFSASFYNDTLPRIMEDYSEKGNLP